MGVAGTAKLATPVVAVDAGAVPPVPGTELFEACAGTLDPTSDECAAALDSVPALVFGFVCSTGLLDDTELAMLCPSQPQPTLGVTSTNPAEPETDGSFVITRSNDDNDALDVAFEVSGTATGADYTLKNGADAATSPVTIPADQASIRLTLDVIDDEDVDPSETVTLTLSAPDGYTLEPASATATIGDNDGEPSAPECIGLDGPGPGFPFCLLEGLPPECGEPVPADVCNLLNEEPTVPEAGDGYFAFWEASLAHSVENLQAGTPPYFLHFQEDGSLRVAGTALGPHAEPYTPETSGTASVYIELDCGALGNVPMLCEAFGFNAEPIVQPVAVGPDGTFVVSFTEEDLAPLIEAAAAFPAPYLPVHIFVNHQAWTVDGVAQHSHFNAASQALYGASGGAAVALADALEDTSFTPLLLPAGEAGVTPPGGEEPVCIPDETGVCVPPEAPCDVDGSDPETDDCVGDVPPSPPGGFPDPATTVMGCLDYVVSEDTAVYLAGWVTCYTGLFLQPPPAGCTDPVFGDPFEIPSCIPDPEALLAALTGGGGSPGDLPVVKVTGPGALDEGQSGVFNITRTGDTAAALAVVVQVGGVASNGQDYAVNGIGSNGTRTVTIPAGKAFVLLPFEVLSDSETEDDEAFQLAIQADDAYEVDQAAGSATVTIHDVPVPQVSIAVDPTSIEEGQSATFTVTRSSIGTLDTSAPLAVGLAATGATAGSDYSPAVPSTLTIPAGQTQESFTVTNVAENVADGGMILVVSPSSSSSYAATGSAGLELRDNDLPEVTVVATDANGAEASTADVASFLVSRTGPTTSTLPITVALGGSAECGAAGDYDVSGLGCGATGMTIPVGQAAVTVTVTPHDDIVKEGQEDVTLAVSAISGVYDVPAASSIATVKIADNDVPTVALRLIDGAASEADADAARFAVDRTGADLTSPITVTLAYSGSAASSGSGKDFDAVTAVALAVGELTKTVTLTPVDDSAIEGTETAVAAIVASGDYQLGSLTAVTINIADNDALAVDTDQDGVADSSDNCVSLANANQLNTDGDAQGNVCDADDDDDGLTDAQEGARGTDPLDADSDNDGHSDGAEVTDGTGPMDALSPDYRAKDVTAEPTGNGMKVAWQVAEASKADRFLVFRASTPTLIGTVSALGLTSYEFLDSEYPGGTHQYFVMALLPGATDTALNDTIADASDERTVELCQAFTADSDGDGLCDKRETELRTDPFDADSDGDGILDSTELASGSDPLAPSTVAASRARTVDQEPLLWVGLTLLLAVFVVLGIGLRFARRPATATATTPEPNAEFDEGFTA